MTLRLGFVIRWARELWGGDWLDRAFLAWCVLMVAATVAIVIAWWAP